MALEIRFNKLDFKKLKNDYFKFLYKKNLKVIVVFLLIIFFAWTIHFICLKIFSPYPDSPLNAWIVVLATLPTLGLSIYLLSPLFWRIVVPCLIIVIKFISLIILLPALILDRIINCPTTNSD